MSMSQEEIEALMNGLDIDDDIPEKKEESTTVKLEDSNVSTDQIEELISQNEEIQEKESSSIEEEISKNNLENDSDKLENNNIDNLLEELKLSENSNNKSLVENDEELDTKEKIGKSWAGSKIDKGIFPLPADNDTKVVNQLSQVANDSEEKVSQIFDVLSLALDNNTEIKSNLDDFESYITSQLELLNSLNNKFPNIQVFNRQIELSNQMINNLKEINSTVNSEDLKIFKAMELMQFNDINRQKIERVMSVIRKLSLYLNNLFEDDGTTPEIAVAKHIHGDEEHDLIGEDLDELIKEFSKKR